MVFPAPTRPRKARGSNASLICISDVLDMVLVRHEAGSTTLSITAKTEGEVMRQYNPFMSGVRLKSGGGDNFRLSRPCLGTGPAGAARPGAFGSKPLTLAALARRRAKRAP